MLLQKEDKYYYNTTVIDKDQGCASLFLNTFLVSEDLKYLAQPFKNIQLLTHSCLIHNMCNSR